MYIHLFFLLSHDKRVVLLTSEIHHLFENMNWKRHVAANVSCTRLLPLMSNVRETGRCFPKQAGILVSGINRARFATARHSRKISV